MKFAVCCHQCMIENPMINPSFQYINIQEEDLYHFKCEKGHDNLLEIQCFKFELLYESGLCSIKDGYFIESVLSITASMERFYEFFIIILNLSKKIEQEEINNQLKIISRQSERLLGGFICLYSTFYRKTPVLISNKKTEFRNSVVHKGYLPNKSEAIDYAEEVFNFIKRYYVILLKEHKEVVFNYLNKIQIERRNRNSELINKLKVPISTMGKGFALSHMSGFEGMQEQEFKDYYNTFMKIRLHG